MRIFSILAIFLYSIGSVIASDIVETTVQKNSPTQLEGYAIYYSNCTFPHIRGQVRGGPKNGTAEVKQYRGKFDNTTGKCEGTPMKYTGVVYTPNPGFTGTDQFAVDFSFDKYTNSWQRNNHRKIYKVIVK